MVRVRAEIYLQKGRKIRSLLCRKNLVVARGTLRSFPWIPGILVSTVLMVRVLTVRAWEINI